MTRTRSARRAIPKCLAAVACALLILGATGARGANWPRFRGPDLDGRSKETDLLDRWPETGPPLLWTRAAGDGFSGMSVVGSRLFTMFDRGDDELVLAFDAATGKELWHTRIDQGYEDDQGGGPRSTPAVDGDRVYALGARAKLVALDASTGEVRWKRDLAKEDAAAAPRWGVSTEPLVDGSRLLVNAGGKDGRSVLALDKRTGAVLWTAEDDPAGYASPLPIQIAGQDQVLFFTGKSLLALAPEDGRRLWRLPWETSYDVNAATPIFAPPDRVFVSSGYDTGSALLKVSVDDKKRPRVETVWASRVLKNKFSSSVIADGHIYGFDDRVLKCVELMTGEEKWKESGLGHGSLLHADDKLFVLSEQGRLVLLEATSRAYVEKGAFEALTGKCWTVPTLSGGRLYVRNETEMRAYAVAEARE